MGPTMKKCTAKKRAKRASQTGTKIVIRKLIDYILPVFFFFTSKQSGLKRSVVLKAN